MNDTISSSSRPPRNGEANSTNQEKSIFARLWARLRGGEREPSDAALRESVEEVLEEHEGAGGEIDPEQRVMLLNVLEFGDLRVDDVMVPRADIVAVDIETPLEQLVTTFKAAHHSRLPVYRGTLDEVMGFVHIKDLIKHWDEPENFVLADVLRQPLVVPVSMPVGALLVRMRVSRVHMALVIDEYGGADGLVTIEDVVEEIVGDIEDEHDSVDGPMLRELPDGELELDARFEIDDLEGRLGVDLLPDEDDEEVDTIGGLIFALAGRVPEKGEIIEHASGLQFQVLEADPRRVKRVRVGRPDQGKRA